MDFLTAMALLVFAWAATLSGVFAGGFLVFKAQGGTSMFSMNKGGAYNIEDGTEEIEPGFNEQIPTEIAKHMDRFRNSFDPGENIFGSSGGYQQYGKHGATRPFDAPVPPKQGERDGGEEGKAEKEE